MRSTEYPYYEDIELLERPKPSIEPRDNDAPSSSENKEGSINILKSQYNEALSDAKKEFEKSVKDYQDQLAAKDLDIIMLKVQLESVEQKSETVIDSVIAKTQKHMESEIARYKKNYEIRIAKIISDAKNYFKEKNIENEKEIAKLKMEVGSLTIKAESIEKEKKIENQKEVAKLKKEIEFLNIKTESIKKEKEVENKKKIAKLKSEIENFTIKAESLKREKENTDKLQEMLLREQEKYAILENKVNKNNRMINQLKQEKKELRYKLEHSKAVPDEIEEKKPKATLFDIVSSILLIGANLLFIFVIFPNMTASNWIEYIGLNDLPFTVRILITLFGVMMSLFCFVKARAASSRMRNTGKKKRKGHSMNFLMGVIVIGVVFLVIFLLGSDFLFFITGTILIILAGLLVIIDHGKSLQEQKSSIKKRGRRAL